MSKKMKIGVLTAGGDCPGLNAAIRGVGKTAIQKYGMEMIGFSSGYYGIIHKEYQIITDDMLSGILTKGGTILRTSREKPFKEDEDALDKPEMIKETYAELGLDFLVCIGGNGTMKTAGRLQEEGLNVIGVPKTIDNDVWGTDITFGFHSAVSIATEAIDRLHTTANSHQRTMVVEVMGHHTGWLALHSGLAGGGDVILLPELQYDLKAVARYLLDRQKRGKPYSIIVVAEGIVLPEKQKKKGRPAGQYISDRINELTGLETRNTILGYIQRGGSPTAYDRIIASELGAFAVELGLEGRFGTMSAYQGQDLVAVPLSEVAGKIKYVPEDHSLIKHARGMDICFGAELS